MYIQDAINDYLRYSRHECGLAKTTIEGYGSYLRHFDKWLAGKGYGGTIQAVFTIQILREYLQTLSERGCRPRTIRSAFYPLRGLGEYLINNEVIRINVAKQIRLPKKDAAVRLLVSDQEVTTLIDACPRLPNAREAALTCAVLSILVYCGLRRQETLDLRVQDVDFDNALVNVCNGKGGKARSVYPCQDCFDALRNWMGMRPKQCQHDWLFAYDANRRVSYDGLTILLNRLKTVAGLKDRPNIQPHSLRHNFATRLMRKGADVRSIQACLGHSDLRTTSLYLHTDQEQLRRIAELGALRTISLPTQKALQ